MVLMWPPGNWPCDAVPGERRDGCDPWTEPAQGPPRPLLAGQGQGWQGREGTGDCAEPIEDPPGTASIDADDHFLGLRARERKAGLALAEPGVAPGVREGQTATAAVPPAAAHPADWRGPEVSVAAGRNLPPPVES